MDSEQTKQWLACPQPNPRAQTRLFVFPYAGGGPAAFGQWPGALPSMVETWIAHYPGRGSRYNEAPCTRIQLLAQNLSQAVKPLLDKPFAFFGHSLGALVAFELTKQLHEQSLARPQILFASACGAPDGHDPQPPIHDLPDSQFIQAVNDINGIPSELMSVPELMNLFLPALRADFEAAENYATRPGEFMLSCPIIALGGIDDPQVDRLHMEKWSSYTTAGYRARYYPGDHFFINTARDAVIASISDELISSHAKN